MRNVPPGRLLATARLLLLAATAVLAGCGAQATDPTPTPTVSAPSPSAEPSPSAGAGSVEPAPASDSAIFAPNPAAIVVALEAGHGGCLDWGVPDPAQRGTEYSEKALTLAIAEHARDLLVAEGITVVMVRDGDVALAGDDYPPLDCHGEPFRDVNGDGLAGFGDDQLPEATRTRDELQARLDVANLMRADALVSIHIDSITDAAGTPLAVARTETFYTDETPWGVSATHGLAEATQVGVLEHLDELATYERQDRGINAHNLYVVAPPLFEETEERPDWRKQPARGALMPAVLVEVGSITHPAEHELLLSEAGQVAAATGIVDGVADFVAQRPLAARIELADADRGSAPGPVEGDGPPFWAPDVAGQEHSIRITNTGTHSWLAPPRLVIGWTPSDDPYLRVAPDDLEGLDIELPQLDPGASVIVSIPLDPPSSERHVAWITLLVDGVTLADHGSPALQIATE
jgi:N-acetylmuramoyl-L-alanine amidase